MANEVKRAKFAPLTLAYFFGDELGTYATGAWSIRAGYPRFTVYAKNLPKKHRTENAKPDYNNIITATFDYLTLFRLFKRIKKLIESGKKGRISVGCYNLKWVDGEKTNDKILQATLIFGRGEDGVFYIAAIEEGKKKVKFELMPGIWHKDYDENGEVITDKAIISKMHTEIYFETLETLMKEEMIKDMTVIENNGTYASSEFGKKQEEKKPETLDDVAKPKSDDLLEGLEDLLD